MIYVNQKKRELRKELKEKRLGIPEKEKSEWDFAIRETLFKSNTFRLTDSLLIYYSVDGEISTHEIIDYALQKGISVFLPRCLKDEKGADIMNFHRIMSTGDLVCGEYGIPAPREDAPLFEHKGHCVCVVPGLSFDLKGYRIGYGKGYYDRFLNDFCGTKIGMCYTEFLKESLPTGKYDYKVDMIITEKGIITPDA